MPPTISLPPRRVFILAYASAKDCAYYSTNVTLSDCEEVVFTGWQVHNTVVLMESLCRNVTL